MRLTREFPKFVSAVLFSLGISGCFTTEEPSDPTGSEDTGTQTESSGDSESFFDDTATESPCDTGWRLNNDVCVFTLANAQITANDIELDEDYVYWATTESMDSLGNPLNDASIRRVKKGGGNVEVIVPSGTGINSRLRVDATHVYWVNCDLLHSGGCSIGRAPKEGGPVQILTALPDDSTTDVVLELVGTSIFFSITPFVEYNGATSTYSSGPTRIMSQPADGSAESTLFYEEPLGIASFTSSPDQQTLYWVTGGLWHYNMHLVHAAADASSPPEYRDLNNDSKTGLSMAVDNEAVYFAQLDSGWRSAVMRRYSLTEEDLNGLSLTPGTNSLDSGDGELHAVGDELFWAYTGDMTSSGPTYIVRIDKMPGETVPLVELKFGPKFFAVDNENLYWIAYTPISDSDTDTQFIPENSEAELLKMPIR